MQEILQYLSYASSQRVNARDERNNMLKLFNKKFLIKDIEAALTRLGYVKQPLQHVEAYVMEDDYPVLKRVQRVFWVNSAMLYDEPLAITRDFKEQGYHEFLAWLTCNTSDYIMLAEALTTFPELLTTHKAAKLARGWGYEVRTMSIVTGKGWTTATYILTDPDPKHVMRVFGKHKVGEIHQMKRNRYITQRVIIEEEKKEEITLKTVDILNGY